MEQGSWGSVALNKALSMQPQRGVAQHPCFPTHSLHLLDCWLSCRAIGLPSGIILFLLTKRQVDKNRLEQLKVRRAMMEANQGEYETERYSRMVRGA